MRSARILAALGPIVGFVSCSTKENTADGPEITPLHAHVGFNEHPAEGREITTLRVRDGFIEIRAGSSGQTFTILDSENRVLAPNLTADEFKAKFPGRYESLERALVDEGVLLDASAPQPRAEEQRGVRFPLEATLER